MGFDNYRLRGFADLPLPRDEHIAMFYIFYVVLFPNLAETGSVGRGRATIGLDGRNEGSEGLNGAKFGFNLAEPSQLGRCSWKRRRPRWVWRRREGFGAPLLGTGRGKWGEPPRAGVDGDKRPGGKSVAIGRGVTSKGRPPNNHGKRGRGAGVNRQAGFVWDLLRPPLRRASGPLPSI